MSFLTIVRNNSDFIYRIPESVLYIKDFLPFRMNLTIKKLQKLCEREALELAIFEDFGEGDITTLATIPPTHQSKATLLAKSDGIVAGLRVAKEILSSWDVPYKMTVKKKDGSTVKRGDIIAEITGRTDILLVSERTVLNMMQRMSGIATKTAHFVKLVSRTKAKILDTRKTSPGLRFFDKEAVRLGGGLNHRFGLYDMMLIKDNHVDAAGSIGEAMYRAKLWLKNNKHPAKIEIEVRNLMELESALLTKPDVILIDNFKTPDLKKAVQFARKQNPKILLEASGGVSMKTVLAIAKTGVDFISVGELTHSVTAMDISMKIKPLDTPIVVS
jgi:nicotinate-nucleotide pyrophosphorylase (carboxylating)